MIERPEAPEWSEATFEGSRRAQLRRALRLTVRERLEALECLAETSRSLAELRVAGRFRDSNRLSKRPDPEDSR